MNEKKIKKANHDFFIFSNLFEVRLRFNLFIKPVSNTNWNDYLYVQHTANNKMNGLEKYFKAGKVLLSFLKNVV